MSEKKFTDKADVSRADAEEKERGNKVRLSRNKTVVVFLDIPHHPSELKDRFRLVKKQGGYDQTKSRSEAVPRDKNFMMLLFTEVPPLGTYSLYHVLTPEIEIPIFVDVPFADLPDHGIEASAAPPGKEPKKQILDLPQPKVNDPLLHPQAADLNLDPKQYLDLLAYRTQESEETSDLA